MQITKKYVIKTISVDGLLKDVKDTYGDHIFRSYGYDSESEAIEAIASANHFGDVVIITKIKAN